MIIRLRSDLRPGARMRRGALLLAAFLAGAALYLWQHQRNLSVQRLMYNMQQLSLFDTHLKPNQHIFVNSAFDIGGSETFNASYTIRVLVATHDRNGAVLTQPPPVFCRNELDDIVVAEWTFMSGPKPCLWKDYFLDCQFRQPTQRLQLIGDGLNAMEVPITPKIQNHYPLVFCVARMFYYENWQIALTSLELYLHHGVNQFVIPIISVVDQLYTLLKRYENMGYVRLKHGVLMPQIPELDHDPNARSDSLNMLPSQTECLYEYRDAADFLIFADLDDVIVPRRFGTLWAEAHQHLSRFPHASSFEFVWAAADVQLDARTPAAFDVRAVVERLHVRRVDDYGKSIVLPRRLRNGIVHFPLFNTDYAAGANYTHVRLGYQDAFAVHLRNTFYGRRPVKPYNLYMNTSDYAGLHARFRSRIDADPELREAFLRLPHEKPYADALFECYRVTKLRRTQSEDLCMSPLECAALRRVRSGAECRVLVPDFEAVHNGYGVVLHRARSASLLRRASCAISPPSPW